MSFIEMVTIQKGGVLQWQRTKMKKENQNKQQNKPETGNPKLDGQTSLLHKARLYYEQLNFKSPLISY